MRASLPLDADAPLSLFVVWLPMLPADSAGAARVASAMFDSTGVPQFYDGGRVIGRAVARSLGAPTDAIAWDMYLLYDAACRWAAEAPRPVDRAHQLGGVEWAGASSYATGDALRKAIDRLVTAR